MTETKKTQNSKKTIDYTEQVSTLLAWGFNCTEIAIHFGIYPSSVRRIKLKLKRWYNESGYQQPIKK